MMDNNNIITTTNCSSDALSIARSLTVPKVSVKDEGELEHAAFWEEHSDILRKAWNQFYNETSSSSLPFSLLVDDDNDDDNEEEEDKNSFSIIEPKLRKMVSLAWKNPSIEIEEHLRKSFFHELQIQPQQPPQNPNENDDEPFVYSVKLLTKEGIQWIRSQLNHIESSSSIPTRRPNGMNRYGVIFDNETDGAIPISSPLTQFCKDLASLYVRPLGRMLFPFAVGNEDDDSDSYSFTVRYDAPPNNNNNNNNNDDNDTDTTDVSLSEHRDASVITLNVNLNLPHEKYSGSQLYFVHPKNKTGEKIWIKQHEPGVALFHLGSIRHAALPIQHNQQQQEGGEEEEEGERQSQQQQLTRRVNLIQWLFGQGGYVRIAPYEKKDQMTLHQRWSHPSSSSPPQSQSSLDDMY